MGGLQPFRKKILYLRTTSAMTKQFVGQVVSSEENNFVGSDQKQVETWRISILLSEDKGMSFSVTRDSNMYQVLQAIEIGQTVSITASPSVRNNGSVRYKIETIQVLNSQNEA